MFKLITNTNHNEAPLTPTIVQNIWEQLNRMVFRGYLSWELFYNHDEQSIIFRLSERKPNRIARSNDTAIPIWLIEELTDMQEFIRDIVCDSVYMFARISMSLEYITESYIKQPPKKKISKKSKKPESIFYLPF